MFSSARPGAVATMRPSSPKRARHDATRSCASTRCPRLVATSAYVKSGCAFSAWLAGIVHGVVVQITAKRVAVGQRRQAERRRELRAVLRVDRERDVDRAVDAVLVLDLGFRERALAVEAPVDRLQPPVHVALLEDLAQRADLVGLVLVGHRRVRMVPVAQHAEALELLALRVDLRGRVRAREPLRFRGRQVLAVRLLDLHLDGHAVAVPAGHVRRVEAREPLALDDDVLEDLVDRVPDVDVAVRVRRPVVQHEARPAGGRRANRLVHLPLLPVAHPAGLAPGQVPAHRERRVGQVQRRLVVGLRIVGHGLQSAFVARQGRAVAKYSRACATSARICRVSASRSS